MVNMTDIFGNALSIAGSFMDSDLVNRFYDGNICSDPCVWSAELYSGIQASAFLDDAGRFSGRRRSCAGGCTYNGNTGEINNADRSTGGRSCVRSDCISDL
mgnify:FL=1